MKKKFISMLLALVMVVGLLPTTAFAADDTQTHENHCVCGGTLEGIAAEVHAESCNVVEEWTALTKDNFVVGGVLKASSTNGRVNFVDNGCYYLAEDISTASVIELLKGADITICLNGHTLTSTTTGNSAIRVSGDLNICDCIGGGKITAKSAKAAGMFNILTSDADATKGTTVNLFGGNIVMTDNNFTTNAGVVQVGNKGTNRGVFNMYGGSISGGTANKGGNILIGTADATMNMYGGSVTGGSVKRNDTSADRNRGGNIYVNLGTLNVYDGIISGGTADDADTTTPALGKDIYQNGGTVYLKGALGNIDYANSGTGYLTLGRTFFAESITVKSVAGVPVKIAEGTQEQAAYFVAANPEYCVAYENGEMILKLIPVETISLRYDDRKELTSLVGAAENAAVSISDEVVTSTGDSHVLVYENGLLIATGTGTAKVTVDGTSYDVTVSAAPISLFMITGHSIGRGEKGNGAQSVAIEAGQAYSTHRYHTYEDTGSTDIINPTEVTDTTGLGYGAANRLTGIDAFAFGQGGNEGEGSALAWQWNQLTGEKVWVINAAVGGSCLNEWIPGAEGHNATYKNHFETSLAAFQTAKTILDREITAGHYTLSHTAIIYHSAANFNQFADWNQELIEDYYDQMWEGYKAALDVEALGLVPIWTVGGRNDLWNDKPANYFMAASNEYPDVFMASLITREWMIASGLKDFPEITYTTQSAAVSKPTSVYHKDKGGSSENSVFCSADTTHLTQVVYNAQGIEIANNMFGYFEGDKTVSSVELRTDRNVLLGDALELQVGENVYANIVTDKVYANDLTITVEGDITVEFPMHIVATKEGSGTITISQGNKVLKTLSVTVKAAHSHCVCTGNVENHVCENVTWTAWGDDYDETYSLPTTAGHYYLTKDMSFTSEFNIGENTEIFLCLNGHNITNTDSGKRVYNIYGKLNICDCSEEENWGTITGNRCDQEGTAVAGTLQLRDNKEGKTATLNLYSGVITSGAEYALKQGGVIQLGNANTYGAVFNMYGGKVVGGNVTTNGGAVYVMSKSTFNMYGGTVTGGTAGERGGCIYTEGEVNISGGKVADGTAKNGGNIYMNTGAVVNITGGVVENGTANTDNGYGGNIRVNAGELTISGAVISGGKAKYGGGLAVQGSANISNSTVQTATGSRGRAIYIDKAGAVTLKDSDIKNLNVNGTTIWTLGQLKLEGIVNMPASSDESAALDIMVDAQKGAACIDITGLTGQDAPFDVRRWEIGEDDDDPGLIAVGATAEQLATVFVPREGGYYLTFSDNKIYLACYAVHAMNKTGEVVQGYDSLNAAIAEAGENVTWFRITTDIADQTIARNVLIDLKGHKLLDLTIADGVVLTGIDSTTNDYDCADGYGLITLSQDSKGTIATNVKTTVDQIGSVKRYLTVESEDGISFHRFYMGITHISFKPGSAALGYKAAFYGDSVITSLVDSYGYNMWVNDGTAKQASKSGPFTSGEVMTLRLQNIMVEGNDAICQSGSTATINGNVFVTFNLGSEKLTVTSSGCACTLKGVLETLNDSADKLNDTQVGTLRDFCAKFADYMVGWELSNIHN